MPASKLTPESIAHALGEGVEIQNGDGSWNTRCPAHADNGPSLTVSSSSTGKLLVHCHGGCESKRVIEALSARGLWPKRQKQWTGLPHAPDSAEWPSEVHHHQYGIPTRSWAYYDSAGRKVGLIHRFDNADGSKEVVPQVWGVDEDGRTGWCWKAFPKPRPLWNLVAVLTNTSLPILVVEGEKTAESMLTKVAGEYVITTWPGGGKAVRHSDFSSFKGRDVILWPDADEPGTKAMEAVGKRALAAGCHSLRLVKLPEGLPKGWDLADPVPEGVELNWKTLVQTAEPFAPTDDSVIDTLNRTFAYINAGDKSAVIEEEPDHEGIRRLRYLSLSAFENYYRNVLIDDGRQEVSWGKYWLDHPDRRSYKGIIFRPEAGDADTEGEYPKTLDRKPYNLWQGYSYEPEEGGDWSMLSEHILQNIAMGDESAYRWIIAWFAQIMQQPDVKVGTSLAIRGHEGTGKTIIGQHFGALIRPHYVLVDDTRHVLGNFNAHLASCLLLHADEAFWAGDPRQVGHLKGMVTGNTMPVEQKGKDVFEVQSYLRLLVTSNDQWLVPASFESRRFAVFDIGNGRRQDKAYFKAMHQQLLNGGYSGLLHHLLNFDLASVDIGTVPQTSALRDQKLLSLNPVMRFLEESLSAGEFPGLGWPSEMPTEALYQSFLQRSRGWGERRAISIVAMMKEIKNVLGPAGGFARIKVKTSIRNPLSGETAMMRVWGYTLPPLDAARQAFENALAGHAGEPIMLNLTDPAPETPADDADDADDEVPF